MSRLASRAKYDAIIVGGGFFGCQIALHLRNLGLRPLILERETELLSRASFNNQARVHNGYHYPRSILTALRSRVNFPKFVAEYEEAIDRSFDQYYAIARSLSKVSAAQFEQFINRIDADIRPAPDSVKEWFDPGLIEDVFSVTEFAFNGKKLREIVSRQLAATETEYQLGIEALSVARDNDTLTVRFRDAKGTEREVQGNAVFNCTYSRINQLNQASDLPVIPLKHELAEIALVDVPEELKHVGITVMCGPFFSLMPFPAQGVHSLSHVRYTPRSEWHDEPNSNYRDTDRYLRTRPKTAFPKMLADVKRYMPMAAGMRYKESLWEVKSVLSQSEGDDSRPILFREFLELPGYTCVLGGKIDNIYDVTQELKRVYGQAVPTH